MKLILIAEAPLTPEQKQEFIGQYLKDDGRVLEKSTGEDGLELRIGERGSEVLILYIHREGIEPYFYTSEEELGLLYQALWDELRELCQKVTNLNTKKDLTPVLDQIDEIAFKFFEDWLEGKV